MYLCTRYNTRLHPYHDIYHKTRSGYYLECDTACIPYNINLLHLYDISHTIHNENNNLDDMICIFRKMSQVRDIFHITRNAIHYESYKFCIYYKILHRCHDTGYITRNVYNGLDGIDYIYHKIYYIYCGRCYTTYNE